MKREVDTFCLVSGALLATFGIAFGAFAAHALRDMLGTDERGWWQTGVQYQMWHAIALVALAALPNVRKPALLILAGTLVFSGCLYLMALTGARWLGMVTPVGGSLMIAGWVLLAWRGLVERSA